MRADVITRLTDVGFKMDATSQPGLYIGVDVGTGSVRAAVVDDTGAILGMRSRPIRIWQSGGDIYEQSTDNIWEECCQAVKEAMIGQDSQRIRGIGFDATCSLAAMDTNFQPVTVSSSGDNNRNVIMWMDHRASEQASTINSTDHKVLQYVGGAISLEMQPPKLLWLKQNLKAECWDKAGHFFDLPDFLTWKATGDLSRSLCSVVCKWTYQADNTGRKEWSDSFWEGIGLGELREKNYAKIGSKVLSPGEPVGCGLTNQAASELGLPPGTPVGASIIDAHAGGLGVLGADVSLHSSMPAGKDDAITTRLALICGTSSCHMAISSQPTFVPGVWGPYFSAMVPGYWLNEGGQSASGRLLDHIVETHPAYRMAKDEADRGGITVYHYLHDELKTLATVQNLTSLAELTRGFHIWPDFHGNRSPLADSSLKGMICGLTLSATVEDLAIIYLATVQAIAHGTRHIISSMDAAGHCISILYACGGLSKNSLFIQTHADVTGLPLVLPKENESVLVGASILGARASGLYPTVQDAMRSMCKAGDVIQPNGEVKQFHDAKHRVFLKMVQHQREYRQIMQQPH
ncbi:FGGY carbohydrate kinase domain-containing protein-like isoform X2 [Acanthaster planci]|uniref:FGGY carbohydrate kinase domain-containing protein n=1 Tax=Acanthaster planci TaxID=133434 RepID=A0A8B7ZWD4_ACAPL|nr:FGGY carbohydrate kinase domain-containing protein-like isoform X2 [Acanthaster planci]